MHRDRKRTVKEICQMVGITKPTLYKSFAREDFLAYTNARICFLPFSEEIHKWLDDLTNDDKALSAELYQPIDCKNIFTDSTCVKSNIHFPIDWVLIRDAAS